MDKIQLLKSRKEKLKAAGSAVRKDIEQLFDKDSFVELSAFSFSKKDFYGDEAEGEGVVTGFATIEGYPYYIAAQNFGVKSGGISKENCDKIVKCLSLAEKNSTPVIYLLNTVGVQIGEGVTVLEGLASLLLRVTQLKGVVPQYAVVNGEVYGSAALIASACDFTFFTKKSVLAVNSPAVLSAKAGKNLAKEAVGGIDALKNAQVVSFEAESLSSVKEKIAAITDLLEVPIADVSEEELNEGVPSLNASASVENVMSALEEAVEIGSSYNSEVKTILCRVGGVSVAAVVFDGGEEGVELDSGNIKKIRSFAEFASCYSLPFITFVNTKGVKCEMDVNNSTVMKDIAEYLSMLDSMDSPKIAVVYGKAVGLGYSLFAAKSMGYDYSCAFATAKIALFDGVQGAEIEFGKSDDELVKKYSDENSDPVNAAKDGYIDDVIEPQFVKQYLTASLQMLLK